METIPRKIRYDLFTPAEKLIYDAMAEVEKMGADVKLTEAVILLAKAKDCVADFVDNINNISSVVIDGVTYWFDKEFEWEEGKWYSHTKDQKYAVDYFEGINKGNLIVFDYVEKFALFKYHKHSLHGSHSASMGKPYLIIGQSEPFLEDVPVMENINQKV